MAPAARRFPHMSPRGADKEGFVIGNVVCASLTVYTPHAVTWAATRSAPTGCSDSASTALRNKGQIEGW
jgi:hypothetical protein